MGNPSEIAAISIDSAVGGTNSRKPFVKSAVTVVTPSSLT